PASCPPSGDGGSWGHTRRARGRRWSVPCVSPRARKIFGRQSYRHGGETRRHADRQPESEVRVRGRRPPAIPRELRSTRVVRQYSETAAWHLLLMRTTPAPERRRPPLPSPHSLWWGQERCQAQGTALVRALRVRE